MRAGQPPAGQRPRFRQTVPEVPGAPVVTPRAARADQQRSPARLGRSEHERRQPAQHDRLATEPGAGEVSADFVDTRAPARRTGIDPRQRRQRARLNLGQRPQHAVVGDRGCGRRQSPIDRLARACFDDQPNLVVEQCRQYRFTSAEVVVQGGLGDARTPRDLRHGDPGTAHFDRPPSAVEQGGTRSGHRIASSCPGAGHPDRCGRTDRRSRTGRPEECVEKRVNGRAGGPIRSGSHGAGRYRRAGPPLGRRAEGAED